MIENRPLISEAATYPSVRYSISSGQNAIETLEEGMTAARHGRVLNRGFN